MKIACDSGSTVRDILLVKTIKDASCRIPRAEVAQYGGVKERTSYVNLFYELQEGNGETKRETSCMILVLLSQRVFGGNA